MHAADAGIRFVQQFAGPNISQGKIKITGDHFIRLEDNGTRMSEYTNHVIPESIEIFAIEPETLSESEAGLLQKYRPT